MLDKKIAAYSKTHQMLPTKPNAQAGMTAAQLQEWYDTAPEEIRTAFNSVLDELASDVGAAQIGATPLVDVPGENIQAMLASLKAYTESHVASELAPVSADASNAVATANTADANATTALNTANTADANATLAVDTANTADANATTALAKAIEVEELVPVINQAVTDAEAAVASVAGKADVSYVDQVAANFVLGVVANDSIVEEKLHPDVREKLNTGTQLIQYTGQITLLSDTPTVVIPVMEYNPLTDVIHVFIGGIYQQPATEYTLDTVNKTISAVVGVWDTGLVFDFIVYKSISIVPDGTFDGALLNNGTVAREKLHPVVRNELDGHTSGIASLQTKAEFEFGNDTFTSGLTHTVTNAFITADTFVNVIPTMEKAGTWSVVSSAGSFTITSDSAETAVTFEWNAIKKGTV